MHRTPKKRSHALAEAFQFLAYTFYVYTSRKGASQKEWLRACLHVHTLAIEIRKVQS